MVSKLFIPPYVSYPAIWLWLFFGKIAADRIEHTAKQKNQSA
jgi:hypothetical protein